MAGRLSRVHPAEGEKETMTSRDMLLMEQVTRSCIVGGYRSG